MWQAVAFLLLVLVIHVTDAIYRSVRYNIPKATCCTSELDHVAARSQGENRRSGHASSVEGIHWRVGASMRHLHNIFAAYIILFEQNDSDAVCCRAYNLTVIRVVWGSYYRNAIFFRNLLVFMVAIELFFCGVICYL